VRFAAREGTYQVHPLYKDIDREELTRLRTEGWGLRALARHFAVSPPTIARRLGKVYPSDYRAKYRPPRPGEGQGGTLSQAKERSSPKEISK
jgi:AraC-like DNA-binding protein